MSNLRNDIVPVTKSPMSHVAPCHMSVSSGPDVASHIFIVMLLGSMTWHVDFEETALSPCRV